MQVDQVRDGDPKRPLALAATEGPSGRRTPLFDEWHTSVTATAAETPAAQPRIETRS